MPNPMAILKKRKLVVEIHSIDFDNKCITWWDGQFDRCHPPNKLYEVESFNDVDFIGGPTWEVLANESNAT